MAAADRGGLQVGADVGLAAAGVAAEADLLGGRVAAIAAAERAVGGRVAVTEGGVRGGRRSGGGGHGGGIGREGVEFLHDVAELEVLLQGRFLRVDIVALGAAAHRLLPPGLADTSPAEVVLARQLYRLHEDLQADGAQKFLLEAALPVFSHLG